MFFKDKLFSKSFISGIVTFGFSTILANLFQFLLFVNLPENIRTDATIILTFLISVLFNFYIHNKYIFFTTFSFVKLINFYITNLLNLVLPILFWFIYEYFYGTPTIFIFNFVAVIIVLSLFPIKFLIYRYIFKN